MRGACPRSGGGKERADAWERRGHRAALRCRYRVGTSTARTRVGDERPPGAAGAQHVPPAPNTSRRAPLRMRGGVGAHPRNTLPVTVWTLARPVRRCPAAELGVLRCLVGRLGCRYAVGAELRRRCPMPVCGGHRAPFASAGAGMGWAPTPDRTRECRYGMGAYAGTRWAPGRISPRGCRYGMGGDAGIRWAPMPVCDGHLPNSSPRRAGRALAVWRGRMPGADGRPVRECRSAMGAPCATVTFRF